MFSTLEEDISLVNPLEVLLQEENTLLIEAAIESLPEEQLKDVIRKRFFDNLTLGEVGEHYNKSRERIRQIEAKALRILRYSRIADSIIHISHEHLNNEKPKPLSFVSQIFEKEAEQKIKEAIASVVGTHTFSNGRTYKVLNTGKPYVGGKYYFGGFHVSVKMPTGVWHYVHNFPNVESVKELLKSARRKSPFDTKPY